MPMCSDRRIVSPIRANRSYTPPDAPLAKYLGMLGTLGFERGVLVQGSAHGRDNSAMLDALERTPDRLRGVAVADESVSPAELRRWDKLGVRALRFNHFFRGGQLHYRCGVTLDTAKTLAPQMKDLGWHLQLWIDCKDMPETIPILDAIGLPVLIDHMGRTDARTGTGTPGFQSLLRYVGDGRGWVKVSGAHRLSNNAPDFRRRNRSMRRWCGPTRSGSCGAATGRIRASRARCRTPATSTSCSTTGRRMPTCDARSSSTIRPGFTGFRVRPFDATTPIPTLRRRSAPRS